MSAARLFFRNHRTNDIKSQIRYGTIKIKSTLVKNPPRPEGSKTSVSTIRTGKMRERFNIQTTQNKTLRLIDTTSEIGVGGGVEEMLFDTSEFIV